MKEKLEFKTPVFDILIKDWTKKKHNFRTKKNAAAHRSFNAVLAAHRA